MKYILLEKEGSIGKIIFNRPERQNALFPELLKEFIEAISDVEQDREIRVLVVTGRGDSFSMGGDPEFVETLKDLGPAEVKDQVYQYFGGAAHSLKFIPKPTIASVNGPAISGGCELALACDFRIASERAEFGEGWINYGLVPTLGGMFLLPHIIGLGRATELIMTGARINAQEAYRIGLVNKVVPAEELEAATKKLAEELAALPPLALAAAKEGLCRGLGNLLNEIDQAYYTQIMLFRTRDFAESAAALREKRKPKFTGT